jgi:hypothetical protein
MMALAAGQADLGGVVALPSARLRPREASVAPPSAQWLPPGGMDEPLVGL